MPCMFARFKVHLGDMPASRSARRLADGVWRATLPRLAAFGAVTAAAVGASLAHVLPGAPLYVYFGALCHQACVAAIQPAIYLVRAGSDARISMRGLDAARS